LAGILEREW